MKAIKGGLYDSDIDTSKKLYTCSTCNEPFYWKEGDSCWYGSEEEMEEGKVKLYFCSEKCIPNPDEL